MQTFHELLAEIELVPVVDTHAHLDPGSPAASNLGDVVFCPEIVSELLSCGAPQELVEADNSAKKLEKLMPHIQTIRNTTAYWGLTRILADLYGAERPLHESDCEEMAARVKERAADETWSSQVLDRAHVEKALTVCEWHKPIPKTSGRFAPIILLDLLVNEPFTSRVLDRLGEVSGQTVYDAGELSKALVSLLDKAKAAGAAAVCASFPPNIEFEQGSRDAADRIVALVLLGQKVDRDGRKALRSYVMDQVLEACTEQKLAFQLLIGTRRVVSDAQISGFETTTLANLSSLFASHPQVSFDILACNLTLAQELTSVARAFANVHLSGPWMYLGSPANARKLLQERLELLPITKASALASQGTRVEWVYAHNELVRRELSSVLAEMVDEGYLARGAAVEAARCMLCDNPKAIYGLQ